MKRIKSTRDTWIPETWRYNGSGYHKNKKKIIYRKRKYKDLQDNGKYDIKKFT